MIPAEAVLGTYEKTFAWVLVDSRRLKTPVPYQHRPGAVIWVELDEATERVMKRRKTEA